MEFNPWNSTEIVIQIPIKTQEKRLLVSCPLSAAANHRTAREKCTWIPSADAARGHSVSSCWKSGLKVQEWRIYRNLWLYNMGKIHEHMIWPWSFFQFLMTMRQRQREMSYPSCGCPVLMSSFSGMRIRILELSLMNRSSLRRQSGGCSCSWYPAVQIICKLWKFRIWTNICIWIFRWENILNISILEILVLPVDLERIGLDEAPQAMTTMMQSLGRNGGMPTWLASPDPAFKRRFALKSMDVLKGCINCTSFTFATIF